MYTFLLLGFLQIVWAFVISFMITEPKIMDDREARRQGRKSLCGKVVSLTKLVWKACKADHALAIGMIAMAVSRNGSML